MKKSAICITLATLALAGCNNDEKNAQARLDNARSMYEQNEFFAAKRNSTASASLYPKEFKVIREGLTLMLAKWSKRRRNATWPFATA